MPSPGALHTELWIFCQTLHEILHTCVDPSKQIHWTDEQIKLVQDMLERWEKTIAPMLNEQLNTQEHCFGLKCFTPQTPDIE